MALDGKEVTEKLEEFLSLAENNHQDELVLGIAMVAILSYKWLMTPRAIAALIVKEAPDDEEWVIEFLKRAQSPEFQEKMSEATAGEFSLLAENFAVKVNLEDETVLWQPSSIYLESAIAGAMAEAVDQILGEEEN